MRANPQEISPEWQAVLLERRCWTSLSVAVVATCTWLLLFLGGVEVTSVLFWPPVIVAAVSGCVCVLSSRALGRIVRQVRKTGLATFLLSSSCRSSSSSSHA